MIEAGITIPAFLFITKSDSTNAQGLNFREFNFAKSYKWSMICAYYVSTMAMSELALQ